MGLGTESAILNQTRKAQGETNDRLDRIIALLEEQNTMLRWWLTSAKSA